MNNPWEPIKTPAQDILSRRINATHPLDLFWGRDPYGHFLFIYEFPSPDDLPDRFPRLNGIEIRLLTPAEINSRQYMLVLILKDGNDWPIFLSLCNDIVTATKEVPKKDQATSIILRRLHRWQEFLKKSRSDLLSETIIKGLIGELFFMLNHLIPSYGAGQAVQFWQGPDDLPQDFCVGNCAIEVKSQLGTTTPRVHISSADQLCSQLPEMYLYVITLGKTEPEAHHALNLPYLIKKIRDKLEVDSPGNFERFNNLIYQTGYVDQDEYLEFNYLPVSEKMFSVLPGFPKICSDQLPSGIEHVSYELKLFDCEPFSATPDWMEQV